MVRVRMDLYVRYTVEFDIPTLFTTWQALNAAANQQFAYVLRQHINLSTFGCYGLPGQSGGKAAMALTNDQELAAYQESVQSHIFEMHIPEESMGLVAGFYKSSFEQQQLQIDRLTDQISNLRQQGQGLQQGFALLQKAGAAADNQVFQLVMDYGQGVAPVVTAMQGSPQDQWIHQQGLRILVLYGMQGLPQLQEIFDTNGLEPIILALTNFPGDAMINQYALHLLALFAMHPQFIPAIIAAKGIQAILTAMLAFPNDTVIQQYGCSALAGLASSSEAAILIVEAKGVEVLVAALVNFAKEPMVVQYAMCALSALAVSEAVVVAIINLQGIAALMTILQFYQQQPQVVFYCIKLLGDIADTKEGKAALANVNFIPVLLTTMKNYLAEVRIQQIGLRCLATIGTTPENQKVIFMQQGIPYIIQAIKSQTGTDEDTQKLVTEGLNLLMVLSEHPECRPQIVQFQGIEVAIMQIQRFPTSTAIHGQTLRLIGMVAAFKEARPMVVAQGAGAAVVSCMKASPDAKEVQTHGAYALGMLSFDDGTKAKFGQDAMLLLLAAMVNHPNEQYIHEHAAAALTILCENDSNAKAFATISVAGPGGDKLSGCIVLNSSVMTWLNYPGTLKQVLKCIGYLAARDASSSELRVAFLSGPPAGLDAMLSAVAAQKDDPVVLYYALKAFVAVVYPRPEQDAVPRCEPVVDVIASAMATFTKLEEHADLQEICCEAIAILALCVELLPTMRAKGVIPLVVKALQTWSKDAMVQRKGCRALANIAEDPENRIEIRKAGGLSAIVESMRFYVQHPEVGEQGCAAIANLAMDDQNRIDFAQNSGIKAVLAALRSHGQHPGIQAYGIGALGNLAVNEDNCSVILKEGAVQMVINAMTHWPGEARVQHFCCLACSNLAHEESNKLAIGRAGGNRLVVASLEKFPDHCGVIEQACGALANLGVNKDNMVEIARLKGIELVVGALKRHPQEKGVQENACFALSKFLALQDEALRQRMIAAGAEEVLTQVKEGDPPPDFDVRICVNVLLRRLTEAPDPNAAPPAAAPAKAATGGAGMGATMSSQQPMMGMGMTNSTMMGQQPMMQMQMPMGQVQMGQMQQMPMGQMQQMPMGQMQQMPMGQMQMGMPMQQMQMGMPMQGYGMRR